MNWALKETVVGFYARSTQLGVEAVMMPSNHAIVSNHRYRARSKPILLPRPTSIILHQPHIHTRLLRAYHDKIVRLDFRPRSHFC